MTASATTNMAYDAFISYSSAADRRLAQSLQRALESFAKPWYKIRACRVFHDSSGLNVTEALWPRLQEAIRDSRHFVLLASPTAGTSQWVQREVAERMREKRPILLALTAGEIVWNDKTHDFDWDRTDAIPRNLAGYFTHEPLYVDLRWAKTPDEFALRHPRFCDAVATLAATIQGVDKDELGSFAVVRHRNAMRLAWSAVALLVFLLGAAITQWIAAVRARDLAESRLEDALGVAQEVVFNIERKLSTVAGGSAVREALLTSTQQLLNRLRGDAAPGSTTGLRLTRAEIAAFQTRGILALTTGDLAAAQQAFESAYEGAKQFIASGGSSDATHWQDLAHAAERLGTVYRMQGKYGEARKKLEHATDLVNYIIREKPDISKYQADLADVHSSWFHLEKSLGNAEAAKQHALKALSVKEALATRFPEDPEYQEAPAYTHNLLGALLVDNASPAAAREHYSRALAIRQDLWRKDKDNAELMFLVTSSYSRVGRTSLQVGDLGRAREELRRGLELATILSKAEPNNNQYVALQANLHGELGLVESTAGNLPSARRELSLYCKLTDQIAARDPESFGALSARVDAYLKAGDLEIEQSQPAAARLHYTVALAQAKILLEAHPDNDEARRLLALAYDKTGNAAAATQDYAVAKSNFLEYLARSEALSKGDERNVQYKVDITQAHGHLAELAFSQRNLAEARAQFEAGLAIARSISSGDTTLQVKRNLWSQLLGLCKVRFLQNETTKAGELCREAVEMTAALLQSNAGNQQVVAMHRQSLEYSAIVAEAGR